MDNSDGTQSKTFPSSPADASISPVNRQHLHVHMKCREERPFGENRTTLTAWVCFINVLKYVTLRSSPVLSSFQIYLWLITMRRGIERRQVGTTYSDIVITTAG